MLLNRCLTKPATITSMKINADQHITCIENDLSFIIGCLDKISMFQIIKVFREASQTKIDHKINGHENKKNNKTC